MEIGVVHVTSVHPYDDIRIFHKECKSLARAGYHVSLIVPMAQRLGVEAEGGAVTIVTVDKVTGRLQRILRTLPAVWKMMLRIRKSTVIFHFHDPELMPVAAFAGIFLRKKVVFDAHEDFPLQIFSKYWIPGIMRKPVSWAAKIVEFICIPFITNIIAATPAIAAKYPKKRTVVVQNFPIVNPDVPRVSRKEFLERENQLVYLGGLSRMQGAIEMVRAFESARAEARVRFVVCGKFENASLKSQAEALSAWRHVEYMGWQNRDGVRKILGGATIGIVVDHPLLNYLEGYSTKMFEYMMAGIPIVCSNFPLWREIVGNIGCGLTVNPLDVSQISKAIVWLISNKDEAFEMGQRGRLAVERQYNWAPQEARLLQVYESLVGQHDPSI